MHDPNKSNKPIKIANRSEKIWLCGFLRLAPFLSVVGAIVLALVTNSFNRYPAVTGIGLLTLIVVAVIVDRSSLLNPTDVIWLGVNLKVKQLVGGYEVDVQAVKSVELIPVDTHDYDDRHQPTMKLVMRISSKPNVSMLVPLAAVEPIIQWATQHQRPIIDRREHESNREE
jgi:hypothetical protein